MATAAASSTLRSVSPRASRPASPGITPEPPLANAITASFVDSCPSTLIRLNEPATASATIAVQSDPVTTASHVTKQSIVARFGEIIPAPFAATPNRTSPSGKASLSAPCLAVRSVVRMAAAKRSPPSAAIFGAASPMPRSILGIGNATPITPVEQTATSRSARPTALAANWRI